METEEQPQPKTSAEARVLLTQAINMGQFEKIPYFEQQIQELENYEEVQRLTNEVYEYQTQLMSQNLDNSRHIIISKKQVRDAVKTSNQLYKRKFKEMKKRQQSEMNDLITRWSQKRNKTTDAAEVEFERLFGTAKILAEQGKVQEAIDLRDAARIQKALASDEPYKEIDEKYQRLCAIMTERHKTELESLIDERKSEIDGFLIIQEEAENQATSDFYVQNSSVVIDIKERFKGTATSKHNITKTKISGASNITILPFSQSTKLMSSHSPRASSFNNNSI